MTRCAQTTLDTLAEKTVRELLKGVKYSIDYYQRNYNWQDKQICELVDDLCGKFIEEFQSSHERSKVADYPHYFLGSIIISKKESAAYIVDGQQRRGEPGHSEFMVVYMRPYAR